MSDRKTLQDDQHYETTADGTSRWQRMVVEERWESLQPDGTAWCSEATREDLIRRHLRSNAHFADHAEWLKEHPQIEGHEFDPVPLARIRKVTRYETGSAWEVVSDVEDLDEMTELLNQPPCQHPVDKIYDGLCFRCCERVS